MISSSHVELTLIIKGFGRAGDDENSAARSSGTIRETICEGSYNKNSKIQALMSCVTTMENAIWAMMATIDTPCFAIPNCFVASGNGRTVSRTN